MTDSANADEPQKTWSKPFYYSLIAWLLGTAALSVLFFGPESLPYSLGALSLLAAGFKITELLVALFTGVAKANASALVIVFSLKLVWWVSLVLLARHIAPQFMLPVALGLGAFLLSILTTIIFCGGGPKISFSNKADS